MARDETQARRRRKRLHARRVALRKPAKSDCGCKKAAPSVRECPHCHLPHEHHDRCGHFLR